MRTEAIRIGTRRSRLALVQTHMVEEKIREAFPDIRVEICEMSTKGDELLDRSLVSFGGKGVFTQELEEALLSGEIDLAVHSAKDMPMEFPEGLGIAAVLPRGEAEDVLVTLDGTALRDLKPGSVVGTGSLRRELQIRRINPLVQVKLIRGNVQTRLKKLADGQYDAIMLAAAGLGRLELGGEDGWHFERLSLSDCLPAAGQAILAVESRVGHLAEVMEAIHDPAAWVELCAERAFLKAVGGSCNAPAAAHARLRDGVLAMDAMYARVPAEGRAGAGGQAGAATAPLSAQRLRRASGSRRTGFDAQEAEALGRELAGRLLQGKVWLVGAGPGDMGLVTRRCLACIRQADVIIYDSLASDSLLNEARRDAELIYAGKRAARHHLKQYETNALLIEKALEGKNVVRLKGGDPFVFGRGGEEAQELRAAGVEYEIVPGVSSCYGAPAYAGIPVTHRDHASSFHVITGHEGDHKSGSVLDYATLAKEEGTLVFLMGLKNLPDIAANLIAHGKDPKTPAAVVQSGTTAAQKTAVGVLETIADTAAEAGIGTPAITVVGDVVSLRREIDWYGRGALSGRRVLVTATEQMAENLCGTLEAEGAEAVAFSLIGTEPLRTEETARMAERIEDYTWAVFTSSNGVRLFFDCLREQGKDVRSLSGIKFAVIGAGTKRSLEEHGIFADFVPSRYSSRDLAQEWTGALGKHDRVLLARAKEASGELPEALSRAGIAYDDVALYHTVTDERKAEELNRILPEIDYVTLCSASAARAYASMLDEKGRNARAKIVCIGPVTARAARAAGLSVHRSAAVYTAEGVRDALLYEER
ncbi:MAG: uroporphyrinogen-III C-methyltransferase [Eubacteriales bacterium]|nr:uroporphyrinogen-III C-methyltransferase [Eubacteriales bacterium]